MTQVVGQRFESLSDAAERTGISIPTLRRRIANGQLAAYRSGPRVLRLDPADVDALMVRVPTMRPGLGVLPPGPSRAAT